MYSKFNFKLPLHVYTVHNYTWLHIYNYLFLLLVRGDIASASNGVQKGGLGLQ